MSELLYIPGLGDEGTIHTQQRYIKTLNALRSARNHIHFFDTQWQTDESYKSKFNRLISFYKDVGRPESIFAISAGASIATALTVEFDEIALTHLVCGKVTRPDTIGQHYRDQAPAFVESVQASEESVKKLAGTRAICYIPKRNSDHVIDSAEMLVPGAEIIDLPPLRHAYAIAYALVRHLPVL